MAQAASQASDATAALLQQLLLYGLLPLWMLAGFGDWLCHRAQRIEHTAGVKESLLHALMLCELAAGIAAVLLLEVNAAVLAIALAACVAHEITTWFDLGYASSRRTIPAVEQWVHSLQLALPWVGLAALMLIHREQAAALLGFGDAPADWRLRWKQPSLPALQLSVVAAAAVMLVGLPFAQELWRCLRARRRRNAV